MPIPPKHYGHNNPDSGKAVLMFNCHYKGTYLVTLIMVRSWKCATGFERECRIFVFKRLYRDVFLAAMIMTVMGFSFFVENSRHSCDPDETMLSDFGFCSRRDDA